MQCLKNLTLATTLILLATPVFAQDPEETSEPQATATEDESLLDLEAFEEGATLSDAELAVHRAREKIELEQITINDQDQDGEVSDNVAINNNNGDNLITGEAFGNATGFLSTVQNTGNNVLIQNSTIINVSVDATSE